MNQDSFLPGGCSGVSQCEEILRRLERALEDHALPVEYSGQFRDWWRSARKRMRVERRQL